MIQGTKGKWIEQVLADKPGKGFPAGILKIARRKVTMIDNAERLDDLRVPPANRLEALKGDRKGQHSIRINDQWRICFKWTKNGPTEVEITDYH